MFFVFFKQKTAFDVRISDWSSDVCSSDLIAGDFIVERLGLARRLRIEFAEVQPGAARGVRQMIAQMPVLRAAPDELPRPMRKAEALRSAEHTSELQSLMRDSYADLCLYKKNTKIPSTTST